MREVGKKDHDQITCLLSASPKGKTDAINQISRPEIPLSRCRWKVSRGSRVTGEVIVLPKSLI